MVVRFTAIVCSTPEESTRQVMRPGALRRSMPSVTSLPVWKQGGALPAHGLPGAWGAA